MSAALDLTRVSRVLEAVLDRDSRPVMLRSMASWQLHRVPTHVAAAPAGLLPAFLVAGDALLREATGKGVETDLQPERVSLLGYRVASVRHQRFSDVMLAMMEATDQIARNGRLMADDLKLVFELSQTRLARMMGTAPLDAGSIPDIRHSPEQSPLSGPSP
ncbi:hypothetical protein [Acidiphilium sp.]|uniref:hypothetical protein n=1 Tax=Acidiphilium sp. TaxID=527 RepID=UPI003D011729